MRVPLIFSIAAGAALLATGHPASAQGNYTPPQQLPKFTIRAGGYFTSSSSVRDASGSSYFAVGLDYDLHEEIGQTRTIASVDYIDRSSGGNTLRVFPVTIGQLVLGTASNDFQPYYGLGVGAYFIHKDFNSSTSNPGSDDFASFGGYAVAGFTYARYLDVDLRYHLITPQKGINPSGLELTAGVRF